MYKRSKCLDAVTTFRPKDLLQPRRVADSDLAIGGDFHAEFWPLERRNFFREEVVHDLLRLLPRPATRLLRLHRRLHLRDLGERSFHH